MKLRYLLFPFVLIVLYALPAHGFCNGVKDYSAAGYCKDDDSSLKDRCDGMYWLVEYYCDGDPNHPECAVDTEPCGTDGKNGPCRFGCIEGRTAQKGELIQKLTGQEATPGTCIDTDKDAEHPDGINYGKEGICVDGNGDYWIDHCNSGFAQEYYCSGSNCIPAPGKFCSGGCEKGVCKQTDTTLSGCCLNPKTVACDWVESRSDCCPNSPNYASPGEKGPKTQSECVTSWFYPTENPEKCPPAVDKFANSAYCKEGCCCRLSPNGVATAELTPSLACKWWVSLEDAEGAGGCTDEFCQELIGETNDNSSPGANGEEGPTGDSNGSSSGETGDTGGTTEPIVSHLFVWAILAGVALIIGLLIYLWLVL